MRCGLLCAAFLPELPDRDGATVGALPYLLPLLGATQRLLPHLPWSPTGSAPSSLLCCPGRPAGAPPCPASAARDPVSSRRPVMASVQPRAENRWEDQRRGRADALTRLTDSTPPRLIMIIRDVRAVQLLRAQVPD